MHTTTDTSNTCTRISGKNWLDGIIHVFMHDYQTTTHVSFRLTSVPILCIVKLFQGAFLLRWFWRSLCRKSVMFLSSRYPLGTFHLEVAGEWQSSPPTGPPMQPGSPALWLPTHGFAKKKTSEFYCERKSSSHWLSITAWVPITAGIPLRGANDNQTYTTVCASITRQGAGHGALRCTSRLPFYKAHTLWFRWFWCACCVMFGWRQHILMITLPRSPWGSAAADPWKPVHIWCNNVMTGA